MTDTHYYRSRSAERRRRRRRTLVLVVVLVVLAAALAAVAGPWFDHFGLSWPGGGGSSAAASSGSGSTSANGITVTGVGDAWHNAPVILKFSDSAGRPLTVAWRMDAGDWHHGHIGRVPAPADHADDGEHVVEVRAASGGPSASYKVRIDTTPPQIGDVSVSPDRISGPKTVTLRYDMPAAAGVKVDWAMVDTLGGKVGEHGAPHAAAGAQSVQWRAATGSGKALFPGTYRLVVTATDPAGNEATATASLGSDAPQPAKLITSLPKAGNLVALTFDGGSGYAWRHIMDALVELDARGTFFCTGVSVNHYPEVAQEAVAKGMVIGNHSFDHPDFQTISYSEARKQLQENADTWWKACKALPTPFFRPPYGSYNATTLKAAGSAGYPFVVNWDVDTGDWTGASPAEIARRAVEGAGPGSIICMHTEWNTQKAIPAMVKGLRAKGLEPVGLDKLFQAAGLL